MMLLNGKKKCSVLTAKHYTEAQTKFWYHWAPDSDHVNSA